MCKKQAQFSEERNKQLNQIKINRTTFYKELKKNIREKSTQIRFNRIKEIVIDKTENILNQLLIDHLTTNLFFMKINWFGEQ